jgi:hypothetical protein
MAKRDYYEVIGPSTTGRRLTNVVKFANMKLQHPVLASASAGPFFRRVA